MLQHVRVLTAVKLEGYEGGRWDGGKKERIREGGSGMKEEEKGRKNR